MHDQINFPFNPRKIQREFFWTTVIALTFVIGLVTYFVV